MQTTISLVLGWFAGLLLAEARTIPPDLTVIASVPAGIGLWLCRRMPGWRCIFAGLLALGLGAGRLYLAAPDDAARALSSYNGRGSVLIQGRVAGRPEISSGRQIVQVRATHISGADFDISVQGDVLAYLDAYPRYHYGDEVRLEGRLEAPWRVGTFDYPQVLARKGIYSIMYLPRVQLLASGQGGWLPTKLDALKDYLALVIGDILPAPQAGLLTAMLIGDDSGIPDRLQEDFRATGTSHIVVISGWNVAILAGLVLTGCTPLLGRRLALWLALATVIGYAALVGFDPPVVRAAVMGGLALLALLTGRQAMALNSLALAMIAMTALRPFMLWDLGFQLSCAATLGLILCYPPLRKGTYAILSRLGAAGELWLTRAVDELLLVTIAAQVFAVPILAYQLGELSLLTLPANLLVLPVQAPLLGLGALATLGGVIWVPLGLLLGYLAWPFLTYTVRMVEWLAALPGISVTLPRLTAGAVVLYYVAAVSLAVIANWEADRRRQIWLRLKPDLLARAGVMGLGVGAILAWGAVSMQPDGRLHIYVLDVGQGDAIFIRSPSGRQILVDGGPDGPTLLSAIARRMPFWDRSLDAVVASHGDSDHITGLYAAMDHYRVDAAIAPVFDMGSVIQKRWEEGMAQGTRLLEARAGLRLWLTDGLKLEVLAPPGDASLSLSDNDRSAVVRVTYGKCSMLLTGDLETEGERMLLASKELLASTVLKVSHHGAATGTSEGLLEAVSPRLAVISVGAGNRFGHPAPATLHRLDDRGIPVWRTDEAGTIELICDGERLWVRAAH